MSIVKGEVDWNSGDVGSGGKTDFMRLSQGTSTVRVMGNPYQFHTNWVILPDGSKKKFNSPVGDAALLERLEEADFPRKARWMVKVLDRSDDKFKLLEIGPQIYNGIKAIFNNPKWGKVTRYDIDIIRAKPGTNPLYSVQPNPKEDLSSEFKAAFIEFNDSVNLDALTKADDPDEIRAALGWTVSDSGSSSETPFSDASDDDEEYSFDFK